MMFDTHPNKVAYQILKGFEKSFRVYSRITAQAKQFFEQALWDQTQVAVKQRIDIYEHNLNDVVTEIYQQVYPQQQSVEFWQQMKQGYQKLINEHPQFELAETFYNSVIGRIFKHQKIDNELMFVQESRCYLKGQARQHIVNDFDTRGTIKACLREIFSCYKFNLDIEDYARDEQRLTAYLRAQFSEQQLASVTNIQILKPVFFRNKAAYLVGRMCMPQGHTPFVIALLLNKKKQLFVDTLLISRRHLSALFGFARSYFLVDSQYPAETVAFLQELLPNKKDFELYISLGYYKHGKTVFYRNFLQHMQSTDDKFELAPGTKGLVMTVFHLPSYGVVFKIIKDEFGESKKISRQHVKNCYKLVKRHDRVGRMADTHEYVNFRLPRQRISTALLEELQQVAATSLEITEQEVIIKHLYIERKMTPLNLYLQQELTPQQTTDALDELGLAIKQIAAANIFPGDMLHKNFGITRHGRVIFYDYDEICYMDERNFRALPKSDDPYALDTLSVAPNDVFPEQFEHFILGKKILKQTFKTLHPEIMRPEYWQQLQHDIKHNNINDVRPYPNNQCFHYHFKKNNIPRVKGK